MKLLKNTIIVVVLALFSLPTYSAVLDVQNGILMGASEVNVDGTLYDVTFQNGSCVSLYGGCDDNSDFSFSLPFNDPTLGIIAMNALLDQVFIDSVLGNFDSNTDLINGCTNGNLCDVFTPVWVNVTSGAAGVVSALNYSEESRDTVGSGGGNRFFETGPVNYYSYAVWNGTPAVVTEPASYLIFASGLFGFLAFRKKNT